jgi:outer membrane protein TolC
MNRKILLLAAFIFIVTGTSIAAQETADNGDSGITEKHIGVEISDEAAIIVDGRRITLSEAIRKAIEINPDIYIEKYNAAMSDTNEMQYNAKYSTLFSAQGGVSSVTNPEMFYQQHGKKNDSTYASASLAKAFSSGTTVAAGVGHTYSKLDTGLGPEYNINSPVVFATVEQELLKNAFGYNDRKQEKILKNATQAQRDAHIYSISMIALEVMTDYWNVVIAQNHLDNSRVMLAETKKVRSIVAEKVNIGLSEKFEINYWNSLVASAKASVTQAEQNYRKVLRKFYRDINADKTITTQEKVVLSDRLPEINSDVAIKTAFAKRADYLNAVRALENAKLSLQINENSSLPSLKGSMSVSSMDYNSESSREAYSNTSNMKYPSYEAKISMTYPLDDTYQKADERNAGWIVEQSKQWLEMTRRYVKDDVITKIENISSGYQLYGEAKEARKQAEMYYSSMIINMKRGRFAASSVRDALDALIKTREMELQLLVVYNASLIEFEVSKNELLNKYNIDINKYIPGE